MRTLLPSLACTLLLLPAAPVSAQVLTFEGGLNNQPVGNLYNGGAGGSLGITFSKNATTGIDADAPGGSIGIANEPSPSTVLYFDQGSSSSSSGATPTGVMNVAAGFTGGFSFFYASDGDAKVSVWDALDAGGSFLASFNLVSNLGGPGDPGGGPGDPNGNFATWTPAGVSFLGVAKSVLFTSGRRGYDNITLGSATPSGAVAGGGGSSTASSTAASTTDGTATVVAVAVTSDPQTFLLTDLGAIVSALFSSVPTAFTQRELSLGGSRTTLRDFNGRLFRQRSGTGNEEDRTSEGEGDGMEYHTVTVGEGDGVEPARGGKGTKVVVGMVNPDAYRWQVFTSFDYGNLDMDADKNFLGLQSDTYAETIGIEYFLTDHLLLGAGVSYLQSFSDQGADLDGVTMAGYVSGTWGGYYADLLYGATLLDHDIDRPTGLGATAHADPGSVVHAVNFNTGYNFYFGNWRTGPFVGVDYAHADVDGYTERGGGAAATEVSEQSVDSLITRLGWQASYRMKTSWGAIIPQVRLGWERENQDSDDELKVGLVQSPFYLVKGNTIKSTGGGFESTVPGYSRGSDYMTAGAGALVQVGQRLDVMLDYQGDFFAGGYSAHFGKISLTWRF